CGRGRGATPETRVAIALIWAGVEPQHPPTMFTRPESAKSPMSEAIKAGLSSYAPNSFGSPAFGYAQTNVSAIFAISAKCARISFAPKAQLRPMENGIA